MNLLEKQKLFLKDLLYLCITGLLGLFAGCRNSVEGAILSLKTIKKLLFNRNFTMSCLIVLIFGVIKEIFYEV